MLKAGKFEPFIRFIRFPHFRNIRDDTQIEFSHPVTALVGPNGTNKTAILRALQGCPDYYNVGQYWFSTTMDPISSDERHRFIHGYIAKSTSEIVEVIKTRIEKENNPDYFEPSRPLLQDGMKRMPALADNEKPSAERTKTRWKAISKSVVYLDFRSELSAYDKYFYHIPYGKLSALREKKAFIRRRSPHLSASVTTGRTQHTFFKRERIVSPAKDVSDEQRLAISRILGREYSSIQIITHKYFDVEGSTVVLKSSDLRYSEAFAGSGEFAVVTLVVKISEAEDRSLILLDEPEVSLHPGAQSKLMDFLAEEAKKRHHQVIISTHSPEIVRNLPANAIKVLRANDIDGKIELLGQQAEPDEAFFRLGVTLPQDRYVYVEDKLAAAIVRKSIRPLGEALNSKVIILPLPGGASAIQTKFIPFFALSRSDNGLVLLDGDQNPGIIREPSSVADGDLEVVLKEQLKGTIQISPNGSGGQASDGEKASQRRTVLCWIQDHLDYLPEETPESLLLAMQGSTSQGQDAKILWTKRTHSALARGDWETVTSAEILAEQERALALVPDSDVRLAQIRECVKAFLSRNSK